jgi:hypothetical protein
MMLSLQIGFQNRQALLFGGSCILQESLANCPFQPTVQLLELRQPIFAQAIIHRKALNHKRIWRDNPVQICGGTVARPLQ